jgi:hypothetical protein
VTFESFVTAALAIAVVAVPVMSIGILFGRFHTLFRANGPMYRAGFAAFGTLLLLSLVLLGFVHRNAIAVILSVLAIGAAALAAMYYVRRDTWWTVMASNSSEPAEWTQERGAVHANRRATVLLLLAVALAIAAIVLLAVSA